MESFLVENLWNRINGVANAVETSWTEEIGYLYKLGMSMDETLQYLHEEKPNLSSFKNWVTSKAKKVSNDVDLVENVLSDDDLLFWEINGYVVIRNAIPQEDCLATQNAIWEFLEKNPEDKDSWYTTHKEQRGLMVNFFHHPTLEKNRASIKIQKAYEQLYQTNAIYKTIDKVSFNPPVSEKYNFLGSNLHWDVSLKLPIPFRLQGLLYLSDCDENDGAFHCVPSFHHKITDWMNALSPEENPRELALKTLTPKPIVGKAGDFIIWNQALPHCATPNYGKTPRLVQYLTYFPENYVEAEEWI
jgi:hypothetical protein